MFQRCRKFCTAVNGLKSQATAHLRSASALPKEDIKKKRNLLFNEEKKRQLSALGRIEKVQVTTYTAMDEVKLIMNKGISTPYDCARHISEGVTKVSALALVDGEPWDMHRPFTSDCELKFLNLKNPENNMVNLAFWRTCSFLLGATIDSAFKDDIELHLHSFPYPDIKSGSFIYNVYLDLPNWKPSPSEYKALTATFQMLVNEELPIERLEIKESLALNMFEDNPFKMNQIPNIALKNNEKVIVYRVGDHIDISKGPMIGNTYVIGQVNVTAVHKLQSAEGEANYRFQGIALPKGIFLNSFAYSILEERARKLNK